MAYFSVTGNTEKVAQQIASVINCNLFQIQPKKNYTSTDLNWENEYSRCSIEFGDPTSRPPFISGSNNLLDYEIIYLGFPIWWDQAPRVINTFMEHYDLTGKTIILFATSGSSTINNAEKALRITYPNVKWQKGKLMNRMTSKDVSKWIKNIEEI